MALEVTQILLNAQSADGSNNDKPPESRKLAALILKNSLDAKEAPRKGKLVQAGIALDASLKGQIKAALLLTLSSLVAEARHTSAQVIAKVAAIELPQEE